MNLKEFLFLESAAPRIVYHYTNRKSLYEILKSGFLKMQKYETSLGGKKVRELSVVRPTMVPVLSAPPPVELSANIGRVRFKIKPHILTSKVRGARIKPIAELPLEQDIIFDEKINDAVPNYTNKEKKGLKRKIIKIIKEVSKKEGKRGKHVEFRMRLKKEIGIESITDIAFGFLLCFDKITREHKRREGEERISIKEKNKKLVKIPLDKNYLKIELLPKFTEGLSIIVNKSDFFKMYNKWKHLFIDNTETKKLEKILERDLTKK